MLDVKSFRQIRIRSEGIAEFNKYSSTRRRRKESEARSPSDYGAGRILTNQRDLDPQEPFVLLGEMSPAPESQHSHSTVLN
jgi:hypothetical protein